MEDPEVDSAEASENNIVVTVSTPQKSHKFEAEINMFEPGSGVPVFNEVQIRPKPGYKYIYEWHQESHKDNWRSDGYRWKQNGKVPFTCGDIQCHKIYFKLRISPVAYTTEFARTVIIHPKYPNKVLVCYEGDDSVVVDFPHGNAKHPSKVSRPYHRTKPSLLRAMKAVKGKAPLEAFADFTVVSPTGSVRSIVDAPRDIKQMRNARHTARQDERLWKEAMHTLYELYNETDFVSDVHVIPQLMVLCFKKSTMEKFKSLLNRSDLPAQCLSCNTSFNMGQLCLSVVTFRETEFEEEPVIPLMFMIHEIQTESAYSFLFLRLHELAPELLQTPDEVRRSVIFTNGEPAVVSALKRSLPDLPRFRCWLQAFRDIKEHLRSYGISQQGKLQEYKNDFIQLLTKNSKNEYTNALVDMVMKWNKGFSVFFRSHIDPDVDQMGAWALRPLGLDLVTTSNPSKALNTTLKRFNGWKESPIDEMVLSLLRVAEFFDAKIVRGQYRQGEGEYTLREHLHEHYDINEPGVVVPDAEYDDDDDILLAAQMSTRGEKC